MFALPYGSLPMDLLFIKWFYYLIKAELEQIYLFETSRTTRLKETHY